MGALNFSVISIGEQQGFRETATSASDFAIPRMTNGEYPKFLYLLCTGGSSNTRVLLAPWATTGVGLVGEGIPMDTDNPRPIILNVHGNKFIRYSRAGGGTSLIWAYPLEDN